jgi:MATE family multidrug resistance protein
VIAVTLNFDSLLFTAMLYLYISGSASVRVSNCLSAGDASAARRAAAGLHSRAPSEAR